MVEKSNAFSNNSKNIKRIKYSVFPCLLGVEFGRQIPKQILAKDFKYRDLIINEIEQFGKDSLKFLVDEDNDFRASIEIYDFFEKADFGSKINNYQEVILETELGDVSLRYYHWSIGITPGGRSWSHGECHEKTDKEICFGEIQYDNNGFTCVTDKTGVSTLILADIAYRKLCKNIGEEDYNICSLTKAYEIYTNVGSELFDKAFEISGKYINNLGLNGVYFKAGGEQIRIE